MLKNLELKERVVYDFKLSYLGFSERKIIAGVLEDIFFREKYNSMAFISEAYWNYNKNKKLFGSNHSLINVHGLREIIFPGVVSKFNVGILYTNGLKKFDGIDVFGSIKIPVSNLDSSEKDVIVGFISLDTIIRNNSDLEHLAKDINKGSEFSIPLDLLTRVKNKKIGIPMRFYNYANSQK